MAEENVVVVRSYFDALNWWLAAYWSDPERRLEQSPELEEALRPPLQGNRSERDLVS
jgi:hypothetical protein